MRKASGLITKDGLLIANFTGSYWLMWATNARSAFLSRTLRSSRKLSNTRCLDWDSGHLQLACFFRVNLSLTVIDKNESLNITYLACLLL
jgi:hypothetical protein